MVNYKTIRTYVGRLFGGTGARGADEIIIGPGAPAAIASVSRTRNILKRTGTADRRAA